MRIVNAAAPIRICDCGGWTDTWFAQSGRVFHIAVAPEVEVQVVARHAGAGAGTVRIHPGGCGEAFVAPRRPPAWGPHPLLEAAVERAGVPRDLAVEIWVHSEVPGGASTGTSAAVAVALVGALDCLTPGRLTAREVAYAAHAVEVELLQQQSGIQDQLCAAHGGINDVVIPAYPEATVTALPVSPEFRWELERRLVLLYLGRTHSSSGVHEAVIRGLQTGGAEARRPLGALREAAAAASRAAAAGDFDALGAAMRANTEAQAALHPGLVSGDAVRAIDLARRHGAAGWKVNGAGGEGGSLTLLAGPRDDARRALVGALAAADPAWRVIPVRLAPAGLRVWEVACPEAGRRRRPPIGGTLV